MTNANSVQTFGSEARPACTGLALWLCFNAAAIAILVVYVGTTGCMAPLLRIVLALG